MNTENQIKIPTDSMPSFIAWLSQYQEKLEIEYDKCVRLGTLTPSTASLLMHGISRTSMIINDLEAEGN
tara:strand:+ start:153 stop:359 length:207 start_codon:yes stop_codon:yes gene_type:complete